MPLAAPISRALAGWGTVAGRRAGVATFLLALALAIALTAGISRGRFFAGVTDQWSATGGTLRRNRAAYNAAFGGLERAAVVAVSSRRGGSAVTRAHLAALLESSRALASARAGPASQADFCARAEPPALLRPSARALDGGNYLAWGYARLTRCLAGAGALAGGLQGLPDGWGVARMPCERASALDCFADGAYDYPPELAELDRYAGAVAGAQAANQSAYDGCAEEIRGEFRGILERTAQSQGGAAATAGAEQLWQALFSDIVPMFARWGYRNRPRLESFGSDEAVARYVVDAIRNARNPGFNSTACFRGAKCCMAWNGAQVDASTTFGDLAHRIRGDKSSPVIGARAIRTAYSHYNENDKRWGERLQRVLANIKTTADRVRASNVLEQNIIDKLSPRFRREPKSGFAPGERFANSRLDFFTRLSSEDILYESRRAPIGLIIAGYVLLAVYVAVVMVNFSTPFGAANTVLSRVGLGLTGLAILTLGCAAGFGLMGWAGVRLSPAATHALPFIALGIGVDDMFMIVLSMLSRGDLAAHPSERMHAVLGAVGPSVFLTSISLTFGFLIASIVRIPGVYAFTYQLAATVAINFVLLLAMFVPACAWDCNRVARRNADILPCIPCTSRVPIDADGEPPQQPLEEKRAGGTFGAVIARFARGVLGPKALFAGWAGSFAMLFLALAFTGAMVAVGAMRSRPGLPLHGIARDGTYQKSFLALEERAFPMQTSYVVHEALAPGALSQVSAQRAIVAQSEAVQGAFATSSQPSIGETSWMYGNPTSLLARYNSPRGRKLSVPVPRSDYDNNLAEWLLSGGGPAVADNVRCTNRKESGLADVPCAPARTFPATLATYIAVRASRMRFVQTGLRSTSDYVRAIRSTQDAVDSVLTPPNMRGFVYGNMYELWSEYQIIFNALWKVVGLTLLGVAVAALLVLPLSVAVVTILTLIAFVLQLYGLCVAIGIQVNAVSVTNFAVGISMGVEFAAHYAHSFSNYGDDALPRVLPALSAGVLSTLLALLPMVGARLPFIRLYYFGAWALMTLLAFINGALVLPALLHLLPRSKVKDKNVTFSSDPVDVKCVSTGYDTVSGDEPRDSVEDGKADDVPDVEQGLMSDMPLLGDYEAAEAEAQHVGPRSSLGDAPSVVFPNIEKDFGAGEPAMADDDTVPDTWGRLGRNPSDVQLEQEEAARAAGHVVDGPDDIENADRGIPVDEPHMVDDDTVPDTWGRLGRNPSDVQLEQEEAERTGEHIVHESIVEPPPVGNALELDVDVLQAAAPVAEAPDAPYVTKNHI